jgi:hypothetical protein
MEVLSSIALFVVGSFSVIFTENFSFNFCSNELGYIYKVEILWQTNCYFGKIVKMRLKGSKKGDEEESFGQVVINYTSWTS